MLEVDMSEEIRVLGYSKGFSDIYKKDYIFVDVVATYEGGKLIEVEDPYVDFPSNGNFFLHKTTGAPPAAGYGVWVLGQNHQPRDENKRHQAEYMALRWEKSAALPTEILPLGLDKSELTLIRERLISGVELKHAPMPNVLWQLKGGDLIGPVHVSVEGSSTAKLIRVDKVALEKPLNYWPAISKSELIEINLRDGLRKFIAKTDATVPTSTIDLAGPEDTFRSVLKFAWESIKGESLITRNQYKQLLAQLTDYASMPDEMKRRAESVVKLLQNSMEAGERLNELANFVKTHASFKSEIEEVKKKAKIEAEESLKATKSEITVQISKLNIQKQESESRVKKFEKEIEKKEKELEGVPDKVMKKVREKIEKAKEDPVELLAQVAIFEPFLRRENIFGAQLSDSSKKLSHSPLLVGPQAAGVTVLAPRERFIDNLKLIGIQTRQAELLGTEVFAAIGTSRVLSFVGSGAPKLAVCLSNTIAAGNSFQINMPLGIVSPDELISEMEMIDAKADPAKASVVIINGANRSAVELFGDRIRDIALESLFDEEFRLNGPIIVFTMIKGETVLKLGQYYGDLGPIFDVDALAIKVSKMPDKCAFACEELSNLADIFKPYEVRGLPQEVEEIKREYCKSSTLFDLGILKVYRHLVMLRGVDKEKDVIQSLLFGWLLPRAFASGISGSEIKEGLETTMDAEVIEPRLAALLKIHG
jgi:hypothetical protein